MRLPEQLRFLAQHERNVSERAAETWPEQVERAVHVGRRQAYAHAAELVRAFEGEGAGPGPGRDQVGTEGAIEQTDGEESCCG